MVIAKKRFGRRTIITTAIAVVFLSAAFVIWMGPFLLCRSIMTNALLNNLRQFQVEHDNHWPTDIYTVATATMIPHMTDEAKDSAFTNFIMGRLTCPGVSKGATSTTNLNEESNYVYINWEPFFKTNSVPQGYPLFYDRKLSNHHGLGINVLTTSGLFFDFRGRWLKDFSAKHPEFQLPLPE